MRHPLLTTTTTALARVTNQRSDISSDNGLVRPHDRHEGISKHIFRTTLYYIMNAFIDYIIYARDKNDLSFIIHRSDEFAAHKKKKDSCLRVRRIVYTVFRDFLQPVLSHCVKRSATESKVTIICLTSSPARERCAARPVYNISRLQKRKPVREYGTGENVKYVK